ncbi:MAG: peptidoglycan-binding protein [Spiribacter sp.]|nr:peptidoglycan-binding protein [Spiribacter sp.]MDR9489428.1 peptidoglycan-binding protein [Spiribacter sp.]
MLGSSRRNRSSVNIWPGFVDALATVLLAFVFVLLIFVVAQLYLSTQLSDRNRALETLQAELAEMADALSMERSQRAQLEEQMSSIYAELHATLQQRDEAREALDLTREELAAAREKIAVSEEELRASLMEVAALQRDIAELRAERNALASDLSETQQQLGLARERTDEQAMRIEDLVAEVAERQRALDNEQQLTADARARVESLRRQINALREQISALAQALRIEEDTVAKQQTEIDTLVERLNVALAEEVQTLSTYRSEFFGRLREVLGDIDEIEIVGDRFRFQSELFFETASADVGPDGEQRLEQVAEILRRIAERIPSEIDWVLQVEGHTDRRPIRTPEFPSNWELSTARAQSIVYFLMDQGIPPDRLAAVGYGEYHPIVEGENADALAQNRRIELRLGSR